MIHFNRLSCAVSFEASKTKRMPPLKSLLGLKTQCISKSSWNNSGSHTTKAWSENWTI